MTRIDHLRLQDYLGHMLSAIERIQRYTDQLPKTQFLGDEMVQDAVIRNFEILGEAGRNIERRYPGFAAAHPELPLGIAYEMRNALAHGYFQVDLEIVWRTIHQDLPALRSIVQRLAGQASSG